MATNRIPVTCPVCGTVRFLTQSRVARGKGKNCSRACQAISGKTHGECVDKRGSPEYTAWISIKNRCLHPTHKAFSEYGGRGITICDQWKNDFGSFLAYVGRSPSAKHSIDRWPNNDGNYEPGNVRWATAQQQARNRRSNTMVTINGERLCLAEWVERLGISPLTVRSRVQRGWSHERALTTPVGKGGRHQSKGGCA